MRTAITTAVTALSLSAAGIWFSFSFDVASAQKAHDHGAGEAGAEASTRAFRAANDRLHRAMRIPFTGDADVDFLRGMIPRHKGAVEMAQIVLEHGSDPEIAELARAIIDAQMADIDWMRAWLAERGH